MPVMLSGFNLSWQLPHSQLLSPPHWDGGEGGGRIREKSITPRLKSEQFNKWKKVKYNDM